MTTVEISCSRRPSSIACQRWARRMPPHLRMRINCNRLATTLADDAALNHTSWPLSSCGRSVCASTGRLEVPFCNRTGLGRARAVAAGIQHHKPKLLHSLLLNLSFGLSWSVMFPIVPPTFSELRTAGPKKKLLRARRGLHLWGISFCFQSFIWKGNKDAHAVESLELPSSPIIVHYQFSRLKLNSSGFGMCRKIMSC